MEPTAVDPLAVITTIGVFGVIVKSIIDTIRRRYPRLDGTLVQVGALLLGSGLAWSFQLRGASSLMQYLGATAANAPYWAIDYLVTGAAIAAGAGFLAEISGSKTEAIAFEVDANGDPVH